MDILSDGSSTNGASPADDDETVEVSPQSELNLLNYRNGKQETLERMDMQNSDIIKDCNSTTIMATKHAASLVIKPKKQLAATVGIARTITNSHPLMLSPTGNDSEIDADEAAFRNANNELQMTSFPDVIPRSEHQQSPTTLVAMTMTMVNTNSNCQKRHNNGTPTSIQNPTSKPQSNINHNKKQTLLRTRSPDLLSSESDADISPYHAAVESNFQTVALIPNTISNIHTTNNQNQQHNNIYNNHNNNHINNNHMTAGHRHLELATKRMGEDISSLDSISNHSFDNEPNLASLSPSSSLMDIDALNENEDDDDVDLIGLPLPMQPSLEMPYTSADAATPTANSAVIDKLPQYSAHEERRDVRNWQKITLPNGSTRDIDMRVIEPYKRVLSHGGYLKAGGHNAIVLFCACYLPDRSRTDYSYVMDNLFLYVVKTLEQLVTEDYVLIYLHGGSDRRSVPPFPWLKKCYQLIDRRLRKSLKNLYLVHPTFWLKSIVWMARPFLSTKFWRKLIYVKTLDELSKHVAVEKAAIPEKVRKYDLKHC